MKIRVLGGGIYGCHLTAALVADGHDVELHEIAGRLFSGASGNIPARLHEGQHYPRSRLTRAACQAHHAEFMANYGEFTRGVPVNIYGIAEHDSFIDYGTYTQVLRGEIGLVEIAKPIEFGLRHIEGAILTGERHIVVDKLRDHFTRVLSGNIHFNTPAGIVDDPAWDLTIDCTFCANDNHNVDRFECCLTVLLEGPTERAVTIMDGPFPSIYPWDEEQGLCSLTSAKWTPLARYPTWREARNFLNNISASQLERQSREMIAQLSYFYPRAMDEFKIVDCRLASRAMPRSGSDARLMDIVVVGKRAIRVRAGKLDAIFDAERAVKLKIADPQRVAA